MKFALLFLVASCAVLAIQGAGEVYKSHGLTCDQKKNMVDVHNELRLKIANGLQEGQPKASNMQRIVWDEDLEKIAEGWALNMTFKHSPSRDNERFTYIGENIAIASAPRFNEKSTVYLWYSEFKDFTYGKLRNYTAGHYTQVVWANTKYMGCSSCKFDRPINKTIYTIYVCNYGPSGNYLWQYPYKTGPGCEDLCCEEQCDEPAYGPSCMI